MKALDFGITCRSRTIAHRFKWLDPELKKKQVWVHYIHSLLTTNLDLPH